MTTETLTMDATKARARADYQNVLGTILRPDWLAGYEEHDSVDYHVKGQVAVRIVATKDEDVLHFVDDYLDPYWNIEIVNDPAGLTANGRNFWIFGTSYRVEKED